MNFKTNRAPEYGSLHGNISIWMSLQFCVQKRREIYNSVLYNSNFLTKSIMGNKYILLWSLFVMFCFFFLNFTVAKDLAKLARNDKSQLRRRHSITLCESRNRKSSTDSNTSTEVFFSELYKRLLTDKVKVKSNFKFDRKNCFWKT